MDQYLLYKIEFFESTFKDSKAGSGGKGQIRPSMWHMCENCHNKTYYFYTNFKKN